MKTMKEFKEEQKQLALSIRELKDKRKSSRHGYVPGLEGSRDEYRYKHVAYCLLRGTLLEKIERKSYDPINMDRVERIMSSIEKKERVPEEITV